MAQVQAFRPIDMRANGSFFEVGDGDVIVATNSHIRLRTPASTYVDYFGSFSYVGVPGGVALAGGFITGLQELALDFSPNFSVSGLFLTVSDYLSFASRDDYAGFVSFALQFGDELVGSASADTLVGFAGNDSLRGAGGNDTIDGSSGSDTAFYFGIRAQFIVTYGNGVTTVTDRLGIEGTDTLIGVETIRFADTSVRGLNRAPVVNAGTHAARVNTGIAATSLFITADADGDAIQAYRLYDSTPRTATCCKHIGCTMQPPATAGSSQTS